MAYMQQWAEAPTQVRSATGQVVIIEDHQGDRPLWSSALLGSNQSADTTLFRYAQGDKVAGANNGSTDADERHTNSDYKGQMADSDDMVVYTVACEFETNIALATLQDILNKIYGEFFASGSKPLYDGMLQHFPAGSGIWVESTANATTVCSNGIPDPNARKKMPVPLYIPPNKQFKFKLNLTATLAFTAADTICRIVFRGFRKLQVQ